MDIASGSVGTYTMPRVPPTFRKHVLEQLVAFRDAIYTTTVHKMTLCEQKPMHNRYVACVARLLGLYGGVHTKQDVCVEHYANIHDENEVLIQLVHTPKCGGRFLKQHLNKHSAQLPAKYTRNIFPRCIKVWSDKHHCTFVFINGHLPARNFTPNALRIGILRDPYARMESAYGYVRNGAKDIDIVDCKKEQKILQTYSSITEFLEDDDIRTRLLSRTTGKKHFFPQSYWLGDDTANCIVDMVLFQETLNDDINHLCDILGIPLLPPDPIPFNVTVGTTKTLTKHDKKLVRTRWWPHDVRFYEENHERKDSMREQFEKKMREHVGRIAR
jgi:hypothetical protein